MNGVHVFIRSNSSAGATSRNQPTGAGGWARVGVRTTSYAAVAMIAARDALCSVARASVKSVADIARPRSRSQRVSGCRRCSCAGSTGAPAALTDQRTSKDGIISIPNGGAMSVTSWSSSTSKAVAAS